MPQNFGLMDKATFKNYKEVDSSISPSAQRLTINLNNGNIFVVSKTSDITDFTISNVPSSSFVGNFTLIIENGVGAGGFINWPNSIKWGDAGTPALSTTLGNIDILTFITLDGGTTWLGFRTYAQGV
jgi:hypothetical protein